MKKANSWTSTKLDKVLLESAISKYAEYNNLDVDSIKIYGFVNSLLAKYGAGKLKEVK